MIVKIFSQQNCLGFVSMILESLSKSIGAGQYDDHIAWSTDLWQSLLFEYRTIFQTFGISVGIDRCLNRYYDKRENCVLTITCDAHHARFTSWTFTQRVLNPASHSESWHTDESQESLWISNRFRRFTQRFRMNQPGWEFLIDKPNWQFEIAVGECLWIPNLCAQWFRITVAYNHWDLELTQPAGVSDF